MTEPGMLSRLLQAQREMDPPAPPTRPGPSHRLWRGRLDQESKARLIDASLGVVSALRVLADVAEDVLVEHRDRLAGATSERGSAPEPDPHVDPERVPLWKTEPGQRRHPAPPRSPRPPRRTEDPDYERIPLTY
jgi:hypothetical protein